MRLYEGHRASAELNKITWRQSRTYLQSVIHPIARVRGRLFYPAPNPPFLSATMTVRKSPRNCRDQDSERFSVML